MKNIKKLPFILSILSLLTIFAPAKADVKVVTSIKPIHSLASYLMDGVGKPDLIVDGYASPHGFALKPWEKISIDELNILEENKLSIAMGILKLKPVNSDKITSVAFTFVFTETNSSLKIKVHHSSPL